MIAVSAPPLAPASKLPPPPIVPTWQLAAAKKQAERTESIPSEWRWEELEIAGPEIDLRQVPQLCLSSKELEVTELDDAATLLDRIASGEWSAEVVCRAFAKRASLAHRLTNCITEFLFDRAFARAEELDAHFKATGAVVGPLHGLPVSLKDQFDIEGVDSTMGFVSLIGKPAKSNSVLVDMLESLGAIIICKTNVPQTLMAEESNNNIFGRTSNPINSSLISGGSSGGEGALVALKGAMVGFGTDFGGSIRKPSTYCGLYGLRPTTRRLPYQGVTNVLKGFKGIESVIGPMARSVKTLQFVTKAIVDAEPWFLDARVIEKPWTPLSPTRPLRVALIRSDGLVHCHPPLQRGFEEAARALRSAGHEVIEWSPFDHVFVQQLFADLATADGGADLRSFLADTGEPLIPETFSTLSPAPKTVHELSLLVTKRDEFRQRVLQRCRNEPGGPIDLIFCPTAPHVAPPPLGAPRPAALISWTTIWSLADLPACTLPVGSVDPMKDAPRPLAAAYSEFDQAHWDTYYPKLFVNAPVVLQLVSPRRHGEESLLAMVEAVETLKRHPKMFTAITYVLAAAALASAMPTSPSSLAPRAVTNDLSNLTIAAVRSAPVNWPAPLLNKDWDGVKYDLNGTVAYAVELIAEAAGQGASVVAFPECWFPGYPKGYDENDWMDLHVEDYIENSMEVNSTQWNTLLAAAKSNAVYVGFGFSERAGDYIYMGQALFSPDGEVLIHRHKLRPSGSERLLWSDGTIEMLQVVSTPIGRIGLLECWEHFHPSMTFPMQVQTEDIHIGSWPYNPSPNDSDALWWEAGETNDAAARVYAINSGAVTVMPVVGHATIFSGTGAALVTIDANVSFVEQPIIYASVNASAFNNVTYNENGEQSWGTLEQITAAIPAYVPKVNGTYTNQVFNSVAGLIATADNFTANDTTPVTTTASVFPVATAGAQAANATSVSTAAAQASAVKTSGGATISAGCFGGILGVVLAVIYPA